MLELLLCSLVTIVPDYLYRRYVQGKRFGRELTLYSVWYELRYGIVTCVMLTVALIAVIFYYHPSTTSVNARYRAVPILPETAGRVAQVHVPLSGEVKKGAPIFRLESATQQAALEVAIRQVTEVDASAAMAQADVAAAEGQIQAAKGAYEQVSDELNTKRELQRRSPGIVPARELERLQKLLEAKQGAVTSAVAAKQAAETKISTLIPAQKASAQAARAQAEVELSKMVTYAGFDGRVEQFVLRVGDVVNPFMRPAGVLIPSEGGRLALIAGFGQIEAQVMKAGMAAEVTCMSKPWTIIPMVVTQVQDYIAAGQVRASEGLVDPQQVMRPGTITVFLEPLYAGGLDGVTPGSSCIANAYTNSHDTLTSKDIGTIRWLCLHLVDTVAIVHAMILRLQALALPIKVLVFSGH